MRTHKRLIDILDPTSAVMDALDGTGVAGWR